MNKKNKDFLLLTYVSFAIFLLVVTLTSVSAVTNLYSPINNTNWTGTVTLSCNTTVPNALNVTFRTLDSIVSGVSTILGTNVSNDTASDTSFNLTLSITALTESASYNVYCTVYNTTALTVGEKENSTNINQGVTFDSTDPICSVVDGKEKLEEGGFNTLSYDITDAIDSAPVVSCSVTTAGDDVVSIGTTTPYTLTGVNTRSIGVYTYNCSGTDYTGNINSCIENFRVDSSDDISSSQQEKEVGVRKSTRGIFIIIIGTIVVVLIASSAIIYSQKSSKRKRR